MVFCFLNSRAFRGPWSPKDRFRETLSLEFRLYWAGVDIYSSLLSTIPREPKKCFHEKLVRVSGQPVEENFKMVVIRGVKSTLFFTISMPELTKKNPRAFHNFPHDQEYYQPLNFRI